MRLIIQLVCFSPIFFIEPAFSDPQTCTPTDYDCSYCASTDCSCSDVDVKEPTFNIKQIEFKWSHADTNTSNDTCSGSIKTCNCNKGLTVYENKILPATQAACTWDDPKRMPANITCSWKDGVCSTTCVNWVQKTCTTTCP